jgi:hypothetical protein
VSIALSEISTGQKPAARRCATPSATSRGFSRRQVAPSGSPRRRGRTGVCGGGSVSSWSCSHAGLLVLAVVTLAPFAFLLLTSLTPLNLARPVLVGLQPPARKLRGAAGRRQVRQFPRGAAPAVRLHGGGPAPPRPRSGAALESRLARSRSDPRALHHPQVLPPIIVAIIWKYLFTPTSAC